MKKKLAMIVVGFALLCTVPVANAYKMNSQNLNNWTVNRGEFTVNEKFIQVAESTLPKEELEFVQKMKTQKGVHNQGNLYVISRGTCPNSGYDMKIVGEKTIGEQTIVYVKLINPTPGKMYLQVLTTPYIVAKTKVPTHVIFMNYDTKQPLF